jgi:hypothetical protein
MGWKNFGRKLKHPCVGLPLPGTCTNASIRLRFATRVRRSPTQWFSISAIHASRRKGAQPCGPFKLFFKLNFASTHGFSDQKYQMSHMSDSTRLFFLLCTSVNKKKITGNELLQMLITSLSYLLRLSRLAVPECWWTLEAYMNALNAGLLTTPSQFISSELWGYVLNVVLNFLLGWAK